MPTVEVDVEIEKDSLSESHPVDCTESADLKPVKKQKKQKTVKLEKSRDEKIDSKLDKIHKKNETSCFSQPINKFKYYALDCNSLRVGDYETMIRRGILVFDNFQEWYDLAIKNEKVLIGFKPMKGADILYKHPKQWATLSMTAQQMLKG